MIAWHDLYRLSLARVLETGHLAQPRGKLIKELLSFQFTLPDARDAILDDPIRNLNHRFMLAEFLWIAGGFNALDLLLPFNKNYGQFSDDGTTLTGAYGPRLHDQLRWVVAALERDPDTRQAVATIWTPQPEPSKDVPCTLAVQFLVRDGVLHSIWTMRSSDLWLGLPYDVFTFAALQGTVAGQLGVVVGSLTMQLGSAHIYREHWDLANQLLRQTSSAARTLRVPASTRLLEPNECWAALHYGARGEDTEVGGENQPGFQRMYRALRQPTRALCLEVLRGKA